MTNTWGTLNKATPNHSSSRDLTSRKRLAFQQAYLEHAVEWVRYANLTQGYGVKYWEIGNENWHQETLSRYVEQNGVESCYIANSVKEIATAMKAVDPSIRIGTSVEDKNWAGTMAWIAGDVLDFLTISNYVGPRLQSFAEYQNTWDKDLIDKVRQVASAIESSSNADNMKIVVSEYNNGHWGTDWELRNDLGHAMVNFDMTGQLISHEKVEFANQWATRYLHDQDEEKLNASPGYYALGKYNELLPSGRSLAIWGEFLKSQMVEANRPKGTKCYATRDPANGELSLFVINKTAKPKQFRIETMGTEGFKRVQTHEFFGNSDRDLNPVWQEGESLEMNGGSSIPILQLKPYSITVVDSKSTKNCCAFEGKSYSYTIVNGKAGGDNNVTVSTAGKNTNDPTWDGTLCWEEIKNAGSNTFYFIELRDTPNGPSLSQFPITLSAKYEGQKFFLPFTQMELVIPAI